MSSSTAFRSHQRSQLLFLPPDMMSWLPEGHLAHFVIDTVGELDLSEIYSTYDGSKGGQPAYHPAMMVGLLLYAYCTGLPSSRKIERATYESIPFRVISGDEHPDHDTISAFRRRHLEAFSGLFVQVLRLCREAGLVKLGHVALDGTKIKANASKHKAMSYGRMERKATEHQEQVDRLLAEAEAVDTAEDKLHGHGKRGDELPEDLRHHDTRKKAIRKAMKALEEEHQASYPVQLAEYEAKQKAREERGGAGRPPKPPSEAPDPKDQYNFTDPDSRIMKSGDTFVQAFNCQAAVDQKSQVIVANSVTQDANDKQQVEPMVERILANTEGQKPKKVTADSGYFSEDNVSTLQEKMIDPYIATEKFKHGEQPPPAPKGRIPKDATVKERMARKLRTLKGRAIYSKRKEIVEPVFGQIKECQGFQRFSFRGIKNVTQEWDLVCLTHNLRKLFRHSWLLQSA